MSWRDRILGRLWRCRVVLGGAAIVGASVLGLGLRSPRGADADGRADGFPPVRTTEEALVELGRRLFFDPVASRSGARSCASCHDPEHGFSDPALRSADDVGRTLRHSQTLLDGYLNPTAHWDGEFDSIEELVSARLGAVTGVRGAAGRGAHGAISEFGGDPGVVQLATRPGRGGDGYGPPTTPSGGPPAEPGDPEPGEPDDGDAEDDAPTTPSEGAAAEVGKRAEVDGTGPTRDARADRAARRAKDASTVRVLPIDLTKLADVPATIEAQGRYAEAFQAAFDTCSVTTARMAEAIASYCRSIRSTQSPFDRFRAGERTALSDEARRGFDLFRGRAGCAQCHLVAGERPTFTDFEFHNTGIVWRGLLRGLAPGREAVEADERAAADQGRGTVTRSSSMRRAFKTPTLRDLTRRGPYMHDGSLATLADVVRHYAVGGARDKRQDGKLHAFEASEQDVADLVAFLETLTGDELPGRAPRVWHARAERQRVRLLDAKKQPLAGLEVTLVPEGDELPVAGSGRAALQTVISDEDGWITFAPSSRTHVRLALPEGLVPAGGPLVPDACREAVVQVPVDGRVTVVVAFEAAAPAPSRLVAEHELTMRLPGHAAPRTVLERVALHDLNGRSIASYQGWLRTDVPADVIVRLPGDGRARVEHRLTLTDARTLKLDLGPERPRRTPRRGCRVGLGGVDAPEISVVIPTYNRGAAAARAVASVLSQAGPSLEVVVVDDGSTDGTARELATRFAGEARLRVLSQANGGTARARNAGVGAARGGLIALLDSDDEWLPGHARAQAALLEARPEVALAICDARYRSRVGRDLGSYLERAKQPPLALADMLAGRWALPSCMTFRADVLRTLPFDPAWHTEDTELLFRFFAAGHRAAFNPLALTAYAAEDPAQGEPRKMASHERAKQEHADLLAAYAAHAPDPAALALHLARRRTLLHARAGRYRAARPDALAWWRLKPLQVRAPWILLRGLFGAR